VIKAHNMVQRILVPLDGSEHSEAILPHAAEIARQVGAELILLYVIPGLAPEFTGASPIPGLKAVQDAEAEMKGYFKKLCAGLDGQDLRATYMVRAGPVPETILEVAQFMHAGLIAMSTHGRTGAQRMLLGSVTDQVVRASPLPVMVIRPKL
jgi:nucleotide-binding universal stress UspA family protein